MQDDQKVNPGANPVEQQRLISLSGNGAMHFNLFDLSSLQIFPTIPQPFLVAAAVCLALWVLVRWGSPLLLLYALTRVCVGEWGQGMIAVAFAVLIEFGNGFASWLEWNAHGRDEWLRQRRRHCR